MSSSLSGRLIDAYDLVLLDLDGVLYLIDRPIPVAVEVVARLRAESRMVAFVTNNASRRADEVARLLAGMGVAASAEEVLTSAGASAAELGQRLPPGAPVLVVGADALREEIRSVGLRPVADADEQPVAVVQGYGRDVGWIDLAEAAVAIRAGAMWIATNTDRTLPSPRGPLPGNGSLVAALRTALDRDPDLVVGKPEPALFLSAARRQAAGRPLVVGDRLDTDIEGAVRSGMDSLLVLTGASSAADLLAAPPSARPTYVAADLTGLIDPDAMVRIAPVTGAPASAENGGWRITGTQDAPLLTGAGAALDALRVLCVAAWAGCAGQEARVAGVRAGSDRAAEVLRTLGLGD